MHKSNGICKKYKYVGCFRELTFEYVFKFQCINNFYCHYIFQSAAFSLRDSNFFIKWGANELMELKNVSLSVTKTVGDLLFEGYDDSFLSFIKNLPIPNKVKKLVI